MSDILQQLRTILESLEEHLSISHKLDMVLANQESTMAAIDDLKAIVTKLAADVAAEIAALQAALTSNNDAAIEEAVTNLTNLSTQLESSVAPKGPTP